MTRRARSRTKEPSIKEKPEFEQKVLDIRRTARMKAGGRRFSFRAVVIIGNKKGKVGVGIATGADVTLAVDKAVRQAKKYLTDIILTPETIDSSSTLGKVWSSKSFSQASH